MRRTADDARRVILDAAEKRLLDVGPSALRLQDIAADAGISHPAILHHFGSRDGLLAALVERAQRSLQEDLAKRFSEEATPPDGAAMLERVADMLETNGHARLMSWLVLSGFDPFVPEDAKQGWQMIVDFTHAQRLATHERGKRPTREDTAFTVALSWLALFGQAILGPASFEVMGLGRDKAAARRFRAWLARLLEEHLEGA